MDLLARAALTATASSGGGAHGQPDDDDDDVDVPAVFVPDTVMVLEANECLWMYTAASGRIKVKAQNEISAAQVVRTLGSMNNMMEQAKAGLQNAKTAILGDDSNIKKAHRLASDAVKADGEQKAAEAAKLYEAAAAIDAALKNSEFPAQEAPQAAQTAQYYRHRAGELKGFVNATVQAAQVPQPGPPAGSTSAADAARAAAGAAAIGAFAGLAFPVIGGLTVAAAGAAAGAVVATRNDTTGQVARAMGGAAASGLSGLGNAIAGATNQRR